MNLAIRQRAAAVASMTVAGTLLLGGVALAPPAAADAPRGEGAGVVHLTPPEAPDATAFEVPDDYAGDPGASHEPASGPASRAIHCQLSNVYVPKTKGAESHTRVGDQQSNYNGTSRTARSTFTAEKSGTVGTSVSSGLTVSVDAMIAKIEGQFKVDLSRSMTVSIGNSISVDTPTKRTTHAQYGVYRLKNTGVSYRYNSDCSTTAKRTITSYTPKRVGWYLWETR
ncbi:hypothetical protein ACWEP8_28205 [Streptomyces hydrogenans]